jgi:hypothetical protein
MSTELERLERYTDENSMTSHINYQRKNRAWRGELPTRNKDIERQLCDIADTATRKALEMVHRGQFDAAEQMLTEACGAGWTLIDQMNEEGVKEARLDDVKVGALLTFTYRDALVGHLMTMKMWITLIQRCD